MPSAQEQFNNLYVTSTEICIDLDVTRASVLNRRRAGFLPDAIEVLRPDGGVHLVLWLREDISPHLDAWRLQLQRRSQVA